MDIQSSLLLLHLLNEDASGDQIMKDFEQNMMMEKLNGDEIEKEEIRNILRDFEWSVVEKNPHYSKSLRFYESFMEQIVCKEVESGLDGEYWKDKDGILELIQKIREQS